MLIKPLSKLWLVSCWLNSLCFTLVGQCINRPCDGSAGLDSFSGQTSNKLLTSDDLGNVNQKILCRVFGFTHIFF